MQLKDATILVVDDEAALVEIFKGWFEREGCRVLTAENGAQALDIAKANRVDAIVSDVRMPVLDGIGLAKLLKENREYISKIVFISGFADIDERDCFDLGVEATLSKPVRRLNLVTVVRRCLMDRDTLWHEPQAVAPAKEFNAVFASLSDAQEKGLIAFGRGGLCVRSALAVHVDEPIGLRLEFEADHRALVGQGIVRWLDHAEKQIGIEIVHVDDAHCGWVAELAEHNESVSFIPRVSSLALA